METKFQTSFIPKRPILASTESPIKVKHPLNLIGIISTFIFIVAALAAGGLFGYQRYLKGRVGDMEQRLIEERSAIQSDLIDKFVRLDTRINSAEQLLKKHVATTLFFDTLEAMTVKDVQFREFTYRMEDNGAISVSMRGVAGSYNALALQSALFNKNKLVREPNFSDIGLDDKGNVVFSLKATLAPDLVAHKNTLDQLSFSLNSDE